MPTQTERTAEELDKITSTIIKAAIAIHRSPGPGRFENVYSLCLAHDLRAAGLAVERERQIALTYKNVIISCAYRADLDVEGCVLVEVKAIEAVAPIHLRQVSTYPRLADYRVGLLLNFGGAVMKDGFTASSTTFHSQRRLGALAAALRNARRQPTTSVSML